VAVIVYVYRATLQWVFFLT